MGLLAYLKDKDNLIKQAQIVVSNPDSNFPAYNAGILPVTLPARCLNHADPMKWHITFSGDTVGVDFIALICHNIPSDAPITIKGANTFDPAASLGTMTWKRRTAFKAFSSTETHQYLKIEISDAANIHGFSQIGYIVLGASDDIVTLTENFDWDWELIDQIINQDARSSSRTPLVGNISENQLMALQFRAVASSALDDMRDPFLDTLKGVDPIFWLPDGTDGATGFLGRYRSDFARRFPGVSLASAPVQIEEDAPGPISLPQMPIIKSGVELPSGSTFTRATIANFKNQDLELVQVASGTLRGDIKGGVAGITVSGEAHHFSEGVKGCLLLEPARTNAWTYSADLSDAVWTKTEVTISADDIDEPEDSPSTLADKILETAVDDDHGFTRATPSLTADTLQAVSFYARAAERGWVRVKTINKANSAWNSWINIATGATGTVNANHTILVEKYVDSWWRIRVSWGSGTGATSPDVGIFISYADAVASYAGDVTKGIHVWGIQFETDKAFPSSYIGTGAATATRNADLLAVAFDFDVEPTTVYVKHVQTDLGTASDLMLVQIGSSADPRFEARIGTDLRREITADDGTTTANNTESAGTEALADIFEGRYALDPDGAVSIGFSLNGATETTVAASGSIDLDIGAYAVDFAYLGARSDGTLGHIFILQELKFHRGVQTLDFMRAL
jgi:hypothetical protein